MSQTPRLPDSEVDDLPRELVQLGERLRTYSQTGRLPRELIDSYDQVVDCVKRRRRILCLVQEALSQLRLDIKYLMFDLEVTRKERDELKQRLLDLENGEQDPEF